MKKIHFELQTNFLIFILGPKFPKSREVTMEGKINFSGSTPGPTDPLCTELTAYIKVNKKVFLCHHCRLFKLSVYIKNDQHWHHPPHRCISKCPTLRSPAAVWTSTRCRFIRPPNHGLQPVRQQHNNSIFAICIFDETAVCFIAFSHAARELVSKEYYIWNSTGTAPVSSGQMML